MTEGRDKQWFVRGQLVIDETNQPIPGLLIRLWDKDVLFDDALDESMTDHDGRFILRYRTRDFDDGGLEGLPDLYLRVHVPGTERVLLSTEEAVRDNAGRLEEFTLRLTHWAFNLEDGGAFLRFRPQLRGSVTTADGTPLEGLRVAAHDAADGRILATDISTEDGVYGCWYAEPQGPTALKVSVTAEDGGVVYRSREPLWYDGSNPVVHQIRLAPRH